MNFFACIVLIVALSIVDAAVLNVKGVEEVKGVKEITQAEDTEVAAGDDVVRMKKSPKPAYGGGYGAPAPGAATTYTYQSPAPTVPCGRNLLFSCQPNVSPVPCSAPAPAPSYGMYAGAYSEPIPVYAVPQFHPRYYGVEYNYGY